MNAEGTLLSQRLMAVRVEKSRILIASEIHLFDIRLWRKLEGGLVLATRGGFSLSEIRNEKSVSRIPECILGPLAAVI